MAGIIGMPFALHEGACVDGHVHAHIEGEGLVIARIGGTREFWDTDCALMAFCNGLSRVLLASLQGMSSEEGFTSSVKGSTRGPRAIRLALRAFCAMSTTFLCKWMPLMP